MLKFQIDPIEGWCLAILRIGLCTALVVQAVSIGNHLDALLGENGIIQSRVNQLYVPDSLPRIGWLLSLTREVSWMRDGQVVAVLMMIYLLSLLLLLAGCLTRVSSVFAWFIHLSLKASGSTSAYGVHEFENIALFYCCFFPVERKWSIDGLRASWGSRSLWAAWGQVVLRLHLCIAYLFSGLEKAKGDQWWNGEAIWRSVMRPSAPYDLSWLSNIPWVPVVGGWFTLIIELGYLVFVWHKGTRRLWLYLVTALHLGIGMFLGLWVFSLVMITLNWAAMGETILANWISNRNGKRTITLR